MAVKTRWSNPDIEDPASDGRVSDWRSLAWVRIKDLTEDRLEVTQEEEGIGRRRNGHGGAMKRAEARACEPIWFLPGSGV